MHSSRTEFIQTHVEYKIIGDQAFTIDNILIYNLFIDCVPKHATVPNILEHFKQFGEVLNVTLLESEKSNKCFIGFADPKDAAKVLEKKYFAFAGYNTRVEACDGLDQPDGQRLIKQLDGFLNTDSLAQNIDNCTDQNSSILTLNDDCLEHICKILPPTDQISFALTCQRFYDVFIMLAKVKYTSLNTKFFLGWTLLKMKIFLQIVGPQIKTLEICKWYKYLVVIKFIGLFCTNVEKLTVNLEYLSPSDIKEMIKKMQLLQELEFDEGSLDDDIIKYLKTFKNLKNLNISRCCISGDDIKHLHGLEILSLAQCRSPTSQSLSNICKDMKNLHYLDIRHCKFLYADGLKGISEHLQQLRTLKLSCPEEDFNSIAELPRLKQLELVNDHESSIKYSSIGKCLKNLAKYQAKQLEELTLDSINIDLEIALSLAELKELKLLHCRNCDQNDTNLVIFSRLNKLEDIDLDGCHFITDKTVLQLLEKCLKLKRINLENCKVLTPEFVRNANIVLQKQRSLRLRTGRVSMSLHFQKYNDDIAKEIHKNDYSDFLEIDYGYDCDESDYDYSDYEYSDDDHRNYWDDEVDDF